MLPFVHALESRTLLAAFPIQVIAAGKDFASDVITDNAGNIYVAGAFYGSAQFSGVTLNSAGVASNYLAKYTSGGTLLWVRRVGGLSSDVGIDMPLLMSAHLALDRSGNVLLTGAFSGRRDFDPSAASFLMTSAGQIDMYVARFTTDGAFSWARRIGAAGREKGMDIAVDANGSILVTGSFDGTVDFNPGAGVSNLTATPDSEDVFILKLSSAGNFTWARRLGGGGEDSDWGMGITTDANANVYTTGFFQGRGDFDPGAGVYNLTSAGKMDIFVSKLNAAGSFMWARRMGSTGMDVATAIALDGSGNVCTTGLFTKTVDFDPGAGTSNLVSAGKGDIFISRLSSGGAFSRCARIGGAGEDMAWGIAYRSNYLYLNGFFQGRADFNPSSTATYNLTSLGGEDGFTMRLASGTFAFSWARAGGGAGDEWGLAVAADPLGNVLSAGFGGGNAIIDSTAVEADLLSGGDSGVLKYTPAGAPA